MAPTSINVTPDLSMYQVLRSHALGELHLQDNRFLRTAQAIIQSRIAYLEHYVSTHNLYRERTSEINADLRWYRVIHNELTQLLMAEFFTK